MGSNEPPAQSKVAFVQGTRGCRSVGGCFELLFHKLIFNAATRTATDENQITEELF